MSPLPRGLCGVCQQEVAVRRGGQAREHRRRLAKHSGAVCPGSGLPVLVYEEVTLDGRHQ